MLQCCKHLYTIHLNNAQAVLHSSNVNDYKRGQGGTAVNAVTFIEERTYVRKSQGCTGIHCMVHNAVPIRLSIVPSHTIPFQNNNRRGGSVHCNSIYKTKPAVFTRNDSVLGYLDVHMNII